MQSFSDALQQVVQLAESREASLHNAQLPILPTRDRIDHALKSLPDGLPERGLGTTEAVRTVLEQVVPAMAAGQAGPRYFGFVTGGQTHAATVADMVTTLLDANVQVNLPNETIATHVEQLALLYTLSLLSIPKSRFPARTFTTGATTSNILGLLCGRDHVVRRVLGNATYSVAEEGLGGVGVDVWACGAHASIKKAASVVGIGRGNVRDCAAVGREWDFDLEVLEERLKTNVERRRGSIVCPSFGEVNTGGITSSLDVVRSLCDKYGAWLHLDAAFGGFAVLHPDFSHLCPALALPDSLTLDAHKWLQAPYDCGLFYARDLDLLTSITGPGLGRSGPAYLSSSHDPSSSPTDDPDLATKRADFAKLASPLNLRLENSSRFRGLPVFATLLSLGRSGITEYIVRNIEFARQLENWMRRGHEWDVLTPADDFPVMNIVLFAPCKGDAASAMAKMNGWGAMYVSPTTWRGRSALRIAVSNWRTGLDGTGTDDFRVVKDTLWLVAMELHYETEGWND